MCVDLPAPAIVPDENHFQYVNNDTDLGRALRQGADCLAWHHPGFGRMPDTIANRMAACEIIGPVGQIRHDTVRAGWLFQAAGLIYPSHSHAAEEIYLPLSGPSDWQVDDDEWRRHMSGDFIHHLPFQPHATRTGTTPLLAVWGWAGDIDAASYDMVQVAAPR
jgi:dimethylpropiothetin dethiomethylase